MKLNLSLPSIVYFVILPSQNETADVRRDEKMEGWRGARQLVGMGGWRMEGGLTEKCVAASAVSLSVNLYL